MINEIVINGETIKVGDWVGFKSDIEQTGEVISIARAKWGHAYELVLKNESGFIGEYIGGNKRTTVSSQDIF